ncbi:MAG: hypothetical protein AAFR66_13565 [Bacteroidota bacterium]
MKKLIRISLLVLLAVLIFGCVNFFKMTDLRADYPIVSGEQAKAQQLMKEMGEAHNIHLWDSIQTYSVVYKDEFYGFMGNQGNPFKESNMTFSMNYIPGEFDGQMTIESGKEKGTTWGIQDWNTYIWEDGKAVLKKDKNMQFWIPTYQYFVELPARIQETNVVEYVGSRDINGTKVEGVLASWNQVAPQKDIDQYILWIDAETKRIVKVDYTVREAYKFISGAAYFNNYKDYNGIILPSELPVESNLVKDGLLHKMSIVDFKPDQVEVRALRPLE